MYCWHIDTDARVCWLDSAKPVRIKAGRAPRGQVGYRPIVQADRLRGSAAEEEGSMRIRVADLSKASALLAVAAVVAACASPGASAPAASGGEQVVQTAAAGEACTFDKYNGSGVPKLDLKAATIGFAQSEKEANPVPDRRDAVDQGRGSQARHQAAHDERGVRSEQGDLGHQGDDRPGRPGADHLAAQLGGPGSGARLCQREERADHDDRPVPDDQDGMHGLHRLGRLRLRGAGQAGIRRPQPATATAATSPSCSAPRAST